MSTTTHTSTRSTTTVQRTVHGAVGGLAGGIVFGLLMQTMGMITMVASLVDGSSSAVGWLVHLAISIFSGVVFALALGAHATRLLPAAVLGVLYGVVWWVVGALVLMPARMGMPVLQVNETAVQSLVGHVLFGLVLGVVFALLTRRDHR